MSTSEPVSDTDEGPTGLPALPTWRGVYVFVGVFFAAIVTLMVILERAFP